MVGRASEIGHDVSMESDCGNGHEVGRDAGHDTGGRRLEVNVSRLSNLVAGERSQQCSTMFDDALCA